MNCKIRPKLYYASIEQNFIAYHKGCALKIKFLLVGNKIYMPLLRQCFKNAVKTDGRHKKFTQVKGYWNEFALPTFGGTIHGGGRCPCFVYRISCFVFRNHRMPL